jgi:type II secretory pathway component GspD/PulD (secretin)
MRLVAIPSWLPAIVLLFALAVLAPESAVAQGNLEILTPQHITVDQALPALRPLLAPGGAISGYNGKIMVRTDPRNLEEIRAALAAIDAPAARLLVSVRREGEATARHSGAAVSGSVGGGDVRVTRTPSSTSTSRIEYRSGSSRIEVGGESRNSTTSSQGSQQVQTVDGGQAFIQAGVSVPVTLTQVLIQPGGARMVQGTVFRDLGSGFYARPQVVGERVRIDISPNAAQAVGASGAARVEELSTTIEGPLGTWIPLGGSRSASQAEQGGWLQGGSQAGTSESSLWLKVERLP